MALIDAYTADSITITPKGTLGSDSRYAYNGTPVVTTAWVVDAAGTLFAGTGREITYDRTMYVKDSETLVVGDKIAYNSTDHEVVEIKRWKDLSSTAEHKKVMVRRLEA